MCDISCVKILDRGSNVCLYPNVHIQHGDEEIPLHVQQNTIMTIKESHRDKIQIETNKEIEKFDLKDKTLTIEAKWL